VEDPLATRRITRTTVRERTYTSTPSVGRELTHEEEMVVRMRQGLSEGHEHVLPRRGQTHAETRAKLALIEATLLEDIYGRGPLAEAAGVDVDQDLKARILAKLSKLDG
jgi:hypothetical protein